MDKKAVKMLAFQSQQQELVTLNVGVILFQTTKTTLHADPSSILACITSSCKHGPSDKNFDFFSWQKPEALWIYPDYLWNIWKIIPSALPREVSTLNEIRNEAKFLELDELSKTLEVNGIF